MDRGFTMDYKLFFTSMIFIALLSLSTVCAEDLNGDLSALDSISDTSSLIDSDDLSIADAGEDTLADNDDSSFSSLYSMINSGSDEINLTTDYAFNAETDGDLSQGMEIQDKNLVINGNNHIIDAKNQDAIFAIFGGNITFNDLTLTNAKNTAIFLNGILTTNNVSFINCSGADGGAIYVSDASYTSTNDKFVDCYASSSGAAIYAMLSSVIIENGLFKSSYMLPWSLIDSSSSVLLIINSTFVNTSSKYATAISTGDNMTIIKKSKFVNLSANRTAGAIAVKAADNVVVEDCEFINVSSVKNGGAIFVDYGSSDGNMSISNSLFEDCLSEFGGALLQLGGNLVLTDSNFTENFAAFNGGAVYISFADAEIDGCIFNDNIVITDYEDYPTYGGAIFADLTDLTVTNSKFDDNSAENGSAIYCYDVDYYFDNLELNGNDNNAICTFFDRNSYIGYVNGTDIIYEDDLNNTYYPSVVEGAGMELVIINNDTVIDEIPARYDLREENLLTPVRDQGRMGACWAFGIYGSLESVILKAMGYETDFSENNLQNSMLVYSPYAFRRWGEYIVEEGGYNLMSTGYLVSWLGAFPQDYDTYDELGKISPLLRTSNDIHIQDVMLMPHNPGDRESTNVKEAILKYGAVLAVLLSKSSADDGTPTGYFNENTSAEYIPEPEDSNHAVAVVGWDDNYPKENFMIQPPQDGAWIIKNSWGSDWGDGGFFYVSYYDQTICAYPDLLTEHFTIPIVINTVPYTKNYQYDFSGMSYFESSEETLLYSNKFESTGDDLIAAVGTYFSDKGIEYKVLVEVNDEDVYSQTGVSPFKGYHTIKLDNYVSVKEGDIFRVSIVSNTVPICNKSRVHYEEESSIVLYTNGDFEDLTAFDMVACLKAYTLEDDSIMIPHSNVSEKYESGSLFSVKVVTPDGHPVCGAFVEFTIDNMTYEVMTNEEGIAIFKIPMLNPGNYTLTATYNNQSIEVTVQVNATDATESQTGNESGRNSEISLHPTGNPISLMILSVLSIVGLRIKRKIL